MKRMLLLATLTGLCFSGVSCHEGAYYAPHTKSAAVGGAILGAGAGTIIGHQRGRELEGAAVGAGIGALAGALLGSAEDDYAYQRYRYRAYDPGYDPAPRYESRNYDYSGVGYPVRPVYVNPYPRVTYNLGLGYHHFGGHGHRYHGGYRHRSRCW